MNAPRTVANIAASAEAIHSPEQILALFKDQIGIWRTTKETLIDQTFVDAFTWSVNDENPIHRKDAPYPLVPGMMSASSLPRFLESHALVRIPGFGTMFDSITVKFSDMVFVGESVHMWYRLNEPAVDRVSVLLPFDYKIRVVPSSVHAVEGTGAVRFIRKDLMERMVRMAARRLQKH